MLAPHGYREDHNASSLGNQGESHKLYVGELFGDFGRAPALSFTLIAVSKRTFQIAIALVVFFGILTPLVNCFDTWDKGATAAPANDTELHAAALAVGAGFVLLMMKISRYIPVLAGRVKRIDFFQDVPTNPSPVCVDRSEPTCSPPVIALRI